MSADFVTSVFVPRPMPSVNEWHGRHWSTYHRHRTTWMQELGFAASKALAVARESLPPKPRGKRLVRVWRVMAPGDRRYDDENLKAGCKPILDALKRLGAIHNDSPVWLEHDAQQRPAFDRERAPAVLIEIFDLPYPAKRDACRG